MPTPGRAYARIQRPATERHYPADVTAVAAPTVTVTLLPGTASTTATIIGTTPAVGARVLVLVTAFGNYCLGTIT